MTATGPLLSAEAIWLRRGERELYGGLDLALHAGQAIWLKAPNGRGKTTLLKVLAGLITPEQGRVRWRGGDFADRLDEPRQAISYLDERLGLSRDLCVHANLDFVAGFSLSDTTTDAVIAALDLEPLRQRALGRLSTGQKKRVGMARLLLEDAQVWLLDEPANGLDDTNRARLCQLISGHLERGGSCIFASHDRLLLDGGVQTESLEMACAE